MLTHKICVFMNFFPGIRQFWETTDMWSNFGIGLDKIGWKIGSSQICSLLSSWCFPREGQDSVQLVTRNARTILNTTPEYLRNFNSWILYCKSLNSVYYIRFIKWEFISGQILCLHQIYTDTYKNMHITKIAFRAKDQWHTIRTKLQLAIE